MKIKRGFYYSAVLGGATLLISSSAFGVPEFALALGIILLMAGLYGLTLGSTAATTGENETHEEIQDRRPGSADR
ncbi:MAG: hypothetical protein R3252_03760 [Robiginitalea sp.]|nr:hypothetical protein [Robiginitalea sp.]